jgi:cholesterol transport system auxiliary component
MRTPWAWCVVALLPQLGCALLSKSDIFVSRYFTPETTIAVSDPSAPNGLELRLGRVNSAAYIKDRLIFRGTANEVGYYEEKRWTENPGVYVRRALTRALFDRRGIRQIVAGAGPTLDVDVVAFEEGLSPAHVGRVQLTYSIYDERVVRFARSVTVERPVAGATGNAEANAVVQALSMALADAVDSLADQTAAELRLETAAPDPTAAAAPP